MKLLIVDDEPLALKRLERLLQLQGIEEIHSFEDPLEALEEISKTRFDAAFLDISMPQISGLELANKILDIEPDTCIVFQTAYDDFALKAYESGGVDYILKPVDEKNLKRSLEKISRYIPNNNKEKKLIGKYGDTLHLIKLDDIFYIKADLDEVIVRTAQVEVYVKKKIGELDQFLKNKNFFRIHRSIIVNVDKIDSMQTIEQSKFEISFRGIDDIVSSSKDGAKEFREYLDRRSI